MMDWDKKEIEKLADLPEETLTQIFSLLNNGFLKKYEYDEETKLLSLQGRKNVCQAEIPLETLLAELEQENKKRRFADTTESKLISWDPDQYLIDTVCVPNECKKKHCILWMCGKLQRAADARVLDAMMDERDALIEQLRTERGPYHFDWQPLNGLKYVEESHYQLALKMVRNELVRVDTDLTEGNRIRIHTNKDLFTIPAGSAEKETNTSHMSALADKPYGGENWWNGLGMRDSLMTATFDSDSLSTCVFFVAGYIQYLEKSGQTHKIREDREWYAAHKREAEPFMKFDVQFIIDNDLFLDEPESLFEVAEILQERNYVSLYTKLHPNHSGDLNYAVSTSRTIEDYENFVDLKQDIETRDLDTSERRVWYLYSYENNSFSPLPKPIALASYIDYLKKTAQYEAYKEHRKTRQIHARERFEQLKREIPKLGKVAEIAENVNESGLYCVIEGERGVGKRDIVQQIATLLTQKDKIDSANYQFSTFEDLADELGSKNLLKRRLYVLSGLPEFLYKSRTSRESDGSAISYLIKKLGQYQPQTYIIVIGEKRPVSQFLNISSQIKFLFGDNVIPIENLPSEQIYNTFREKLSAKVREELERQGSFQSIFLDYLALNRRHLPLNNEELANYLADYANNKNELILPPDVYRDQSVKEMLAPMVGMENVKKAVFEFEQYAHFLKRAEMNGMKLPGNQLHMVFTGNPGTGKTMIARVLGQMLYDLGIVEENKVIEAESKDLKSPYIGDSAAKTTSLLEKAMGGVLFIDEAYSIGSDILGKEIIATLVKAMEDHKDKLVIIFAGYEKEMHGFLNINPGIASRIGYTFHFRDYSTEELVLMFDRKMKKAGFTYDLSVLDAVADVCDHFRGQKNFGNGRFVDKLIQRTILNQSTRNVSNDWIHRITKEEIPTVSEMVTTDVVPVRSFEEQLDEFIGLETVKEKVRSFADFVRFQQIAKEAGATLTSGNMHMIFTGNPGTGKTAIARMMADMLFSIGVIKENKLMEVERKDLVAEYVGQTAVKTAEVIERAMNGVLFVDEAYTLSPKDSTNDFGKEAIATLIKAMEDYKGNLVVIFAGYREEMRNFLNSNPGIASRIGNTFHFPDYSTAELLVMFERKMEKSGFTLDEGALKKAEVVLEYFSGRKNFGNGRFVDKLVNETLMQHSGQIHEDQSNLLRITDQDVPDISDLSNQAKRAEVSSSLDAIVGLQKVKETVKEFEAMVNFSLTAKEEGLTVPDLNLHMLFTGNSGTGKTTVARLLAEKLYDIGILMEKKLVEVERKDLVAGYLGQTAEKVADVIDSAIGGVLFVDEAYTLTPTTAGDYGAEAIATLIKAMEDHKDDLIVIFAGYEEEMKEFVQSNPGIASRIGFTFHFEDYTPEELTEIFMQKMKANGFTVTEQAKDKVQDIMSQYSGAENFGNGRFVDQVIQNALLRHATNPNRISVTQIDDSAIPDPAALAHVTGYTKSSIGFRSR